jgi:hypothetical protein
LAKYALLVKELQNVLMEHHANSSQELKVKRNAKLIHHHHHHKHHQRHHHQHLLKKLQNPKSQSHHQSLLLAKYALPVKELQNALMEHHANSFQELKEKRNARLIHHHHHHQKHHHQHLLKARVMLLQEVFALQDLLMPTNHATLV